jgi:hypothetical protein
MARARQIILMQGKDGDDEGAPTLGRFKDVLGALERFNTAPDGSQKPGNPIAILHGPGMVVEIPTSGDRVNQAIVTLVEEEIAFSILMRLCKKEGWRMVDAESGRAFG